MKAPCTAKHAHLRSRKLFSFLSTGATGSAQSSETTREIKSPAAKLLALFKQKQLKLCDRLAQVCLRIYFKKQRLITAVVFHFIDGDLEGFAQNQILGIEKRLDRF